LEKKEEKNYTSTAIENGTESKVEEDGTETEILNNNTHTNVQEILNSIDNIRKDFINWRPTQPFDLYVPEGMMKCPFYDIANSWPCVPKPIENLAENAEELLGKMGKKKERKNFAPNASTNFDPNSTNNFDPNCSFEAMLIGFRTRGIGEKPAYLGHWHILNGAIIVTVHNWPKMSKKCKKMSFT